MLLEVANLSVSYAGCGTVADVSFALSEGEVLTIVGESGSGKTTVIRAIMRCLPHSGQISGGTIFFDGADALALNEAEWRRLCGVKLAMIFQDSGSMLDPIKTVGSQFTEYIREHVKLTRAEATAKAHSMLVGVHLSDPDNIMASYPFELSGGMRQRVGVAMAMTFKPKLLLADEPTSALDVTTQAKVVREMTEICRRDQTAIILVTHNIGVAAYMSDKIIVMKNGRIVEGGATKQIISNPQSAYTRELLSAVPQLGGRSYV